MEEVRKAKKRSHHKGDDHEKSAKRPKESASSESQLAGDHSSPKKHKKDKKLHKLDSKRQREADVKTRIKSETQSQAITAALPSRAVPFFSQTVSLWIPLYPVGFDRPLSCAAEQHLDGLVNHYSPQLGGYLLAYRNVNLSEYPARRDERKASTEAFSAVLASVDEYAVGFGWMTADIDLFVPSRGALLEGNIILQNEGSIGVSCWEKFNASIEAARLPSDWKFVDSGFHGESDEAADADPADSNDGGREYSAAGADQQAPDLDSKFHATGHWIDGSGKPVQGRVLFHIKDFDVGLAGDNGYLAIEGTMLSDEDELRLARKEREKRRASGARGKTRRLPDFSITQFGKEEEEDDSGRHVEMYKGSRAVTPDD